jgi:hypothetical protein
VAEVDLDQADLQVKLEAMQIKDPTAVLASLQSLGLEFDTDFSILSDGERDEMMTMLGASGVSLGDRSKVRHHFGALLQDDDTRISGYPTLHEGMRAAQDGAPLTASNLPLIGQPEAPPRRQLQSSGGISSDSLALMATAALGILSFIVQARASANEQKKQAEQVHPGPMQRILCFFCLPMNLSIFL